jgi:hypothetical protein
MNFILITTKHQAQTIENLYISPFGEWAQNERTIDEMHNEALDICKGAALSLSKDNPIVLMKDVKSKAGQKLFSGFVCVEENVSVVCIYSPLTDSNLITMADDTNNDFILDNDAVTTQTFLK